ncbi:putative superoxide dismutase [Ilyonectria robusta]
MVKAVAVLRGDAKVSGTVIFEQESESAPTTITYDISGNDPNAERGFHVHTFGDNTNGCTSAGPHFNPFGKTHGAPTDETRHVGDLGNIKTDGEGVAKGSITDSLVKLIGPHSIVGATLAWAAVPCRDDPMWCAAFVSVLTSCSHVERRGNGRSVHPTRCSQQHSKVQCPNEPHT